VAEEHSKVPFGHYTQEFPEE